MTKFKIATFLFTFICLNFFAQDAGINQAINVEKYQGKEFTIEGKIFYENELKNDAYAVLGYSNHNNKGIIKKMVFNSNDEGYYQFGKWSAYQLTGKIEKNAIYLNVMAAFGGYENYYLDDLKVYINDGYSKIEVPLINSGFESGAIDGWHTYSRESKSKFSVSEKKVNSGKYALYVDNSGFRNGNTFGNNSAVGKFVEVNGVKLYYEIYGKGEPMLLINGNNSSMSRFENQLEVLRKKYMVIGLDSRGQGKSTGNDEKLTYELMAEDVNMFLEKLNLKNVNILGWSDGGNIGVILARDYPDKVKSMAIMGTVLYNNETSVKPEINILINKQLEELDKKGISKNSMDYRLKVLLLTEPNINPETLKAIKSPTLVMAGENDVMPKAHTKLIADKIPNSEMVIFKGGDHETPEKMPELFNKTILKFFDRNK